MVIWMIFSTCGFIVCNLLFSTLTTGVLYFNPRLVSLLVQQSPPAWSKGLQILPYQLLWPRIRMAPQRPRIEECGWIVGWFIPCWDGSCSLQKLNKGKSFKCALDMTHIMNHNWNSAPPLTLDSIHKKTHTHNQEKLMEDSSPLAAFLLFSIILSCP